MTTEISRLANELVELLRARGSLFATAESCTGGAIASAVTSVAGCSDVMYGGVVAYHNSVKQAVLGVSGGSLEAFGAVSEAVVREMVEGAAARFGVDCAVATSGIAGPGGGTAEKPVGTVWVAVKVGNSVSAHLLRLHDEGRENNIKKCVAEVLRLLLRRLGDDK